MKAPFNSRVVAVALALMPACMGCSDDGEPGGGSSAASSGAAEGSGASGGETVDGDPVSPEGGSAAGTSNGSGGTANSPPRPPVVSEVVTSITRHGITWTFDGEHEAGQFVGGDWWVVGPVQILAITPAGAPGRSGSMVDPLVGDEHGFDDRLQRLTYVPELDVSRSLPVTVEPGSVLVSTQSHETTNGGDDSYLQQLDVLTVVETPSSSGDFRPPWLGPDHVPEHNEVDVDYEALGSHQVPAAATSPDLEAMAERFEYPWIEMSTSWIGRYYHATNNHPTGNYGREMAHAIGDAALALQLDFSDEEKRKLLLGVVQAGIDIYGVARSGAAWSADGGHNQGRKLPLLLAATVLRDQEMLAYADAERHLIFQEDQTTFYVSGAEIEMTASAAWAPDDRKPMLPYLSGHMGLPEWGIRHSYRPEADNYHWEANYRTVTGSATATHFVAARLMGVQGEWNHPAFFDYYERYFAHEWQGAGGGANSIPRRTLALFDAYVRGCDQGYFPLGGQCQDALECTVGSRSCDEGESCVDPGGPASCDE